ncbi:Uncharacterized protein ESCO_000333 [Escovopsis weberi]|uniref:GIT Spa2 homology (SHD) domain-containing protein n=1 Tax=Escovopsis weberi TaxID=150374 RepID=A0A0M8MTL2_ESCWE|nr:Uncharacterized protein ESCO_000333 [Escovopsis weberi]
MNPGDRNVPLSPVSAGGSEWSFAKFAGTDDGHYPNRGNLVSPPSSGGSPENMSMNGFLHSPKSPGGPSPPSSVGRSSNGNPGYGRNDGPRGGPRPDADEAVLAEHYHALRVYLTSRDPNIKQPQNKARDKLLRLSSVQFYELSTDVYDELIRRQAVARTPPNAPNVPPSYLLPEKTFHPKRNQARQRLSSLGPPRFHDLSADVFYELERRYPHFVTGEIPRAGSSMSNRNGPVSRMGTPANGNMYPPRAEGRMRRPSEASSLGRGGPPPADPYGIPPSPGRPGMNGDFSRPMPRQPNQNKTIVPNKSTMIEEDDEGDDTFNPDESTMLRESKRISAMTSETDKKMIEDYQVQVQDLREKLDAMEDSMKKKEDELNSALDLERSRSSAVDSERQSLQDARSTLEVKLSEVQNLNESLKRELERVRDSHDQETSELRDQIRQSMGQAPPGSADDELKRENEKLRYSLHQQQQATEEVRSEAQECLREMRLLSERSASTYEKQIEMESLISHLEGEVRAWKDRYALTKTQLRNMKGSSVGSNIGNVDVAKHLRDQGFLDQTGLVVDVHVTKFQMAVDELLRSAREESPDEVTEAMKSVVVSVRRITRDIDESTPHGNEPNQRGKLRAKVSATANSLITTCKNFASSAGITPVLLVDAAASHLSVAVVDLLRLVKIRPTPSAELEQEEEAERGGDHDAELTPVEPAGGFFSSSHNFAEELVVDDPLPPPQTAFHGRGDIRASVESSAYSPAASPRASVDGYANEYQDPHGDRPNISNGYGVHRPDNALEDLKIYLGDQNALLVSDIQALINCIRSETSLSNISEAVKAISAIVDRMVAETRAGGYGDAVARLLASRDRLLNANRRGEEMANAGSRVGGAEWRSWMQTLPPIAFEIARESKEVAQKIGQSMSSSDLDDFS